jgi:hypothetical protein
MAGIHSTKMNNHPWEKIIGHSLPKVSAFLAYLSRIDLTNAPPTLEHLLAIMAIKLNVTDVALSGLCEALGLGRADERTWRERFKNRAKRGTPCEVFSRC